MPTTCPAVFPCQLPLYLIRGNHILPSVLIGANHTLLCVLIGADHILQCVLPEEREKGSPTFGFEMNPLLIIYQRSQ